MTHFPLTKAGGNTIWQSVPLCKCVDFMALFESPPGPNSDVRSRWNVVGARFADFVKKKTGFSQFSLLTSHYNAQCWLLGLLGLQVHLLLFVLA